MNIGIVGGTGPEGRGLAVRFASAGHDVIIGSRDRDRAEQVANEVASTLGDRNAASRISGAGNIDASRQAELIFVAVPYAGLENTLASLRNTTHNKICVSVIAPIEVVGGIARLVSVSAGSAAEEAERIAPGARWVSGFHTLPARDLVRSSTRLDTDCLVCSDDAEALASVMELAEEIPGLRAVNSGRLENSRYLEGMTALLININRIYKAHGSIRIAGIS